MAKKKDAKPTLYSWNGGKKTHSIPQAAHDQNVQAQGYGLDLNANPLARPAFAQAVGQAAAEYGPQLRATQGVQAALPRYFADYLVRNAAAGQAQQQYAAPILAQANAWANQSPQAAPGLDPSSAAYGQSQQAATSGQGLAKLGADTVAAIPLATQGYLSGQADLAARQLAPAQAAYAQQFAGLKSDQAAKTAGYYGTNIQNAQNADIAYQTLDLNKSNTSFDNAVSAGYDPTTGEKLPTKAPTGYASGGPGLNKYGYTYDEWNKLTPAQQNKERAGNGTGKTQAEKDAEKAAADAKKRHTAVQKATGAVKSKVTDIIDTYNTGGTVNDTTKAPDQNGTYPQRKATPAEMRALLISKNGYLARIALAVKDGKLPLDQKAIDYLKQKYPDFRVPREWLKASAKNAPTPTTNDPKPTSGQQGGVGGK